MAKFSIKQVTTKAKKIRKEHPRMSWHEALAKAGKAVKSGAKVSGKKRTTHKKAPPKRRAPRKVLSGAPEMTLAQLKAATKKMLTERLGWLHAAKRNATTVKSSNNFTRKIREVERAIDSL